MDSLKDLTQFLKTQASGASFGELKNVFADEAQLKLFIKSGLDLGIIQKEGQKRGTRYFVGTITKKVEVEENAFEKATSDMEVFLKSDKPVIGQPYICKITSFGTSDKSIKQFLDAGVAIRQTTIAYNKQTKKNEIICDNEKTYYNMISFSHEGKNFIFTKFFVETTKQEREIFPDYESFREHIRSVLNLPGEYE